MSPSKHFCLNKDAFFKEKAGNNFKDIAWLHDTIEIFWNIYFKLKVLYIFLLLQTFVNCCFLFLRQLEELKFLTGSKAPVSQPVNKKCQESITRSFHMCCTPASTLSRLVLFSNSLYRKKLCFQGRPHMTAEGEKPPLLSMISKCVKAYM